MVGASLAEGRTGNTRPGGPMVLDRAEGAVSIVAGDRVAGYARDLGPRGVLPAIGAPDVARYAATDPWSSAFA